MSIEHLINIGNVLLEELQLDDPTDTLAKWISHYLSELLSEFDNTSNEAKKANLKTEIKDVIFKLWDHRYNLARPEKSIKKVEVIANVLELLNPNNEELFYAPLKNINIINDATLSADAYNWLKMTLAFDKTAKNLINDFIIQAYKTCETTNSKLAQDLKEIGMQEAYEVIFYDFLNTKSKMDNDAKKVESKIQQIDELALMLQKARTVYEVELEQLENIKQ